MIGAWAARLRAAVGVARVAFAAAWVLAGCATVPTTPVERGLYHDLRVLVQAEARTDWLTDTLTVEKILPRALLSVCQTPPEHRAALRAWLAEQVRVNGGPAEAAWQRAGRDLGAVGDLLLLERVAMVLDTADRRSAECPFWLEPREDFAGVQADAKRFVLMLESQGGLQVLLERGEASAGGGGMGRVMPAYGLNERITLAAGVELGLSSTFPRGVDGTRSVQAVVTTGVPMVVRINEGAWRFDSELAFVARTPERDLSDWRPGARISQGVGLSTVRVAGGLPYIMLWVGHEVLPAYGENPTLQVMRVGTRVGIDWEP